MNTKLWTLHFDGSCEPINPGGNACYGWVLYSPDHHLICSGNGFICSGNEATNNVAEYGGLYAGLSYLQKEEMKIPLLIKGDSKLVVNQVKGLWKIRKEHLQDWVDKIHTILPLTTTSWDIQWIPREENDEADYLSGCVENLPTIPLTAKQRSTIEWIKEKRRSKTN